MIYGSVRGKRQASVKSHVLAVKKQASTKVKKRQRTWEKASKCQKPRTVSEKTGFDKREITIAYVGKGKQVSKATYGQEKTSFDKGGKAASGNSGVAILLHRKLYFMTTDSTEKCI